MYERDDAEQNLVCNLRPRDDETFETLPPERGGGRLMSAAIFQLLHRNAPKVRLRQPRPTLQMLIQRRLRANEDRSLIHRD